MDFVFYMTYRVIGQENYSGVFDSDSYRFKELSRGNYDAVSLTSREDYGRTYVSKQARYKIPENVGEAYKTGKLGEPKGVGYSAGNLPTITPVRAMKADLKSPISRGIIGSIGISGAGKGTGKAA